MGLLKSQVETLARGAPPLLKKLATRRNLLAAGATLTAGYYLFSGTDDDYNTIPGMYELGLAAQQRKILTDFGSGFDPIRAIARGLGMSYKKFLKSGTFKQALKGARVVEEISAGQFGRAELMEMALPGVEGPELIQFVRKTTTGGRRDLWKLLRQSGRTRWGAFKEMFIRSPEQETALVKGLNLKREAKLMRGLEETEAFATVYGASRGELLMELMPGKQIGKQIEAAALPEVRGQIQMAVEDMARERVLNLDMHLGNVLYDPASKRISVVDLGLAKRALASRQTIQERTAGRFFGLVEERRRSSGQAADFILNLQPPSPLAPAISPPGKRGLSGSITPLYSPLPAPALLPQRRLDAALQSQQLQSAQKVIWEGSIRGGRGHLTRSSDRSVAHSTSIGTIKPGAGRR